MIPVILSGGNGTRLWPMSRKGYPKQFLPLVGSESMFQQTLQRLPDYAKPPILVCNESHRFIVAEQTQSLGCMPHTILLEPFGRNTAPAVAIAAFQILAEQQDDNIMLVLPADHSISDKQAYHAALAKANTLALEGKLVTFGIEPSKPETGYGYVRKGRPLPEFGYEVSEFVEKPDKATAEVYLSSGEYLWNSGMFMMDAQVYLDELKVHALGIYDACKAAFENMNRDYDFGRIPSKIFQQCPDDSIDYAVMEHTAKAVTLPLDCSWSDVGVWSALWDVLEKDTDGNVMVGDVVTHNAKNSYIRSNLRLTALVGVEDLIVVDSKDALLIAHKDHSQDIKHIVNDLQKNQRCEAEQHREVARPWGTYDSINSGERFQVKRIRVNPGASLSLQKHHHRAEHWIVVSGTAIVTCGDKEFLLSENQSTYIPIGEVHRLRNPGKIPLDLIEVQSGSYLGEDDIVRLQDVYGRTGTGTEPVTG
ncbi:MAG: mannose-1-phosphate guanylyltransferase/mannose-6-phosphate isomerase [Ketobacteraceae bacterium]|nr:mannose-1-phosphate guanylyltransferase/mannose-6-phosphate isomerase [Ketobacteraceae bacterium]